MVAKTVPYRVNLDARKTPKWWRAAPYILLEIAQLTPKLNQVTGSPEHSLHGL